MIRLTNITLLNRTNTRMKLEDFIYLSLYLKSSWSFFSRSIFLFLLIFFKAIFSTKLFSYALLFFNRKGVDFRFRMLAFSGRMLSLFGAARFRCFAYFSFSATHLPLLFTSYWTGSVIISHWKRSSFRRCLNQKRPVDCL